MECKNSLKSLRFTMKNTLFNGSIFSNVDVYKVILMLLVIKFLVIGPVFALPFNDDMVESQISSGQIMRPSPKDSVAKGTSHINKGTWMETAKVTNPSKSTKESLERGGRLYQINCMPCHGIPKTEGYEKGEVGKIMGPIVPNLAIERIVNLSDGHIYSTIRNGSLSKLMPAIGYKISVDDTWDIVNYLRKAQKGK